MIKRILKFIEEDIWTIRIEDYNPVVAFLIRQFRIILMAVKGFRMNRIQLRASALTYYTTLSVVPIVAMVFGIAKGFGFQSRLEAEIRENLAAREEMQEVLEYIIDFAQNMLSNVNGGFIAGVGVVLLFWSVMSVLGNIERAFNSIWRIKKSRTFFRKFSDYLSMMLIAPVLFFVSSTVTVFISESVSQSVSFIQVLGPLVKFLVNLVPYALIFLLFTLLYVIMPNTKVSFKS
jgi:membrane protein